MTDNLSKAKTELLDALRSGELPWSLTRQIEAACGNIERVQEKLSAAKKEKGD